MLRGAIAIFRRDFKKFLSNPLVMFMTLVMPIMYLVVFGNAIGGTITGIPIGAVQEEPYVNYTPLFAEGVTALQAYHQPGYASLFVVTVYSSEDIARHALDTGQIMAYVVFPSDIAPNRPVRLYVDSSEYTIPALIESGVATVLVALNAPNPLYVDDIYGTIHYIQFFGVGVIVLAIFMTTMMGGGIALIRDRELGIIEGYLVTPVKRSSIILGTIGSGTVRAFLAGFIIFVVDIVIAGVMVRGVESFLLVLLVLFMTSIGVTSLVVAISSRFSNQQEYASTIAFFSLILFMTSGAFYPVIGMPPWLKWITYVNPEAYAVHALRSIILRGQGIAVIAPDLIALLIFSLGAIMLGIMTYRRTLE
ncbi:ABC-2 type transport system permease protein [Methanolinea mesophila]|uniref:ABC transporter permease n=1 Tax=Methanolinea mesophila TaxID=547055 RepID=UPI001AE1DD20|nr:ABC transporter permease [Methanolinea mesophila]MBP1929793.1 ABC-2 type transport system permease protein [Methanolinea mesophila]